MKVELTPGQQEIIDAMKQVAIEAVKAAEEEWDEFPELTPDQLFAFMLSSTMDMADELSPTAMLGCMTASVLMVVQERKARGGQ